ncbi:acyltransferase [Gelidibacter salicanalis]|uniref:Acyltransferase n=1 Tax=Gelidibacter salicanalis TaxID=291193 RepID=A0A5C7AKE8_9FLAO|nr:acyltransferase [Gelidibacter salicanalis]TXE09270.1 acyltransferase [Gelidibacter salicanalis]
MAFLDRQSINSIGFKSIGENILISDKAAFYNPELISIGSNVRIDDFCLLSGTISLGNYIHLSAYNALYGKLGITMEDFSGLSPRCTVFSASDDFSGQSMISPMVPSNLTNVSGGEVKIGRFSQVGANCIILPNLELAEGTVIGAMSLVKESTKAWSLYAGCPAKYIKPRNKNILNLYKTI